jgi:RNA polymerase sigma-70 factor (ECF subfamily)
LDDLSRALADDLDDNFERLVLTYQDRVFAFALRLTGNPSDAEEVAQDAFVRAYRALARYPSERVATLALRPWL